MTVNIIDELKKIKSDSGHIKTTIKKLEQQQEETKKQLYLFEVLNLVQKFEEMIKNKTFEKVGIYTADITVSVEEDIGNVVKFFSYDKDNLLVDECFYHKDKGIIDIPEVIEINKLFLNLNGINSLNRDNMSNDLKTNKVDTFKLEEGCSKIILDALLSKELKTLLDYCDMQCELSNGNESSHKKLKM